VRLEKRPGVLQVGEGRLHQFVMGLVEIFLGHGAGWFPVSWAKSRAPLGGAEFRITLPESAEA
jgi:hypothetical protein